MKSEITLFDIAYARSGDKGSNANIGVIAYTEEGFHFLQKYLTVDKVENFFKAFKPTKVVRFELKNLWALNFVLVGVLEGGGNLSLRADGQGKALGQAILEMPIEISEEILKGIRKKP